MNHFFSNLKLAKKMLLAPLIVLVFLIILAYFTFSGFLMQKAAIDDIFNNRFQGHKNSAKVMNDISNVQGNLFRVMNWGAAAAKVGTIFSHDSQEIENLAKKQLAVMNEDIELVKRILASGFLTAQEKKLYQAVLQNLLEYQKITAKAIELAKTGSETVYVGMSEEQFVTLSKSLSVLLDLEEKLSKDKYGDSIRSFTLTMVIFIVLFLAAVILSCLTSILIARRVTRPIHETITGIKRLADGDLTQDINHESNDEIGELVQQLNSMREKMGGAVGEALQVSEILFDSSTQEAASIEETSASLDEIASMTRQNASSTTEANRLMNSAKKTIQDANASMSELTSAMKEIAQASVQTQKIVKSIDEIAFQTNLLALNASVEAARAGEAGAGFAVVADEVRNLAMRATESAKNSSRMIENIVTKVRDGENLVQITSSAFTQVTASSAKVVDLMEEIATASHEQAQGIDQINSAIAGMNTTTQVNTGNAEKLASIMSIFKTDAPGGSRYAIQTQD